MNFTGEVTKMEFKMTFDKSEYGVPDFFSDHPEDIRWYKSEIHKKDVENVFHIFAPGNWGPITNYSFRVEETIKMLEKDDKDILESNLNEFNRHRTKIQDMLKNGFDDPLKWLILIAKDQNGPFTILDGNHRFAAHHKKNFRSEENYLICDNVFVGISQNLTREKNFLYTR